MSTGGCGNLGVHTAASIKVSSLKSNKFQRHNDSADSVELWPKNT